MLTFILSKVASLQLEFNSKGLFFIMNSKVASKYRNYFKDHAHLILSQKL